MFKKLIIGLPLLFILSVVPFKASYSATSVSVSGFSATELAHLTGDFTVKFAEDFAKVTKGLSEGFTLGFATTDLIGSTKIKTWELGLGVSGLISGDIGQTPDGAILPHVGGGLGVHLHFGLAGNVLSKKLKDFDFIFKIFYLPTIKIGSISFDAFAVGLKTRWNFINPSGNLIKWGGLTLGLSLDYSRLGVAFDLNKSMNITSNGFSEAMVFRGTLDATSNFFSVTPEIMTSATFFKFLTPFLSAGVVLKAGSFDLNKTISATANSIAGFVSLDSSEDGNVIIPYARLGIDFNLWVLNLTVQGTIAFGQSTYYGGGVGLRTEW